MVVGKAVWLRRSRSGECDLEWVKVKQKLKCTWVECFRESLE